mmetsp:Transcript_43543/g.123285  ORF Transcript_43543/g.123285 Transcript_43543/m.123285 type:complete len:338 (-) Transcript_43543:1638-2651(-)
MDGWQGRKHRMTERERVCLSVWMDVMGGGDGEGVGWGGASLHCTALNALPACHASTSSSLPAWVSVNLSLPPSKSHQNTTKLNPSTHGQETADRRTDRRTGKSEKYERRRDDTAHSSQTTHRLPTSQPASQATALPLSFFLPSRPLLPSPISSALKKRAPVDLFCGTIAITIAIDFFPQVILPTALPAIFLQHHLTITTNAAHKGRRVGASGGSHHTARHRRHLAGRTHTCTLPTGRGGGDSDRGRDNRWRGRERRRLRWCGRGRDRRGGGGGGLQGVRQSGRRPREVRRRTEIALRDTTNTTTTSNTRTTRSGRLCNATLRRCGREGSVGRESGWV